MIERLVFPGHIADLKYIIPAIKVYADAGDWVNTADYIDKEFAILKANKVEDEKKSDPTDYTKDAELLRYFGLVERRIPGNVQSDCRITESGKQFYYAYVSHEETLIWDVLMNAFEKVTFGRNNDGCPSCNTRLEAPNILLISSLLLDGVTRKEYASILWQMLYGGLNVVSAIMRIKLCRYDSGDIGQMVRVDNKVVPFLINLGFLFDERGFIKIPKTVRDRYQNRIAKLKATNDEINNFLIDDSNMEDMNTYSEKNRQLIIYGAPGTGKSHSIKDDAKVKEADEKKLVFRTTFHPDSDYSTFVGAYKPTMKPVADKYKAVAGKDEEITYEFIPQAFLQAYIAAWNNQEENVFLVIEEINRGNCAQIFGDLFQLLDRDDDGYSEYPIKADRDLAKYLSGKDENGNEVLVDKDGIKDGKLKLPKNLYIWATMNTSDQSLFPIDSAFKRRWDWLYIPIGYKNNNWIIEIGLKEYDWVDFQHKINEKIYSVDNSEDKQLGDFFVNANRTNNIISSNTLLNKILFYIWNDVCKDDPDQIFRWKDDQDSNKEKSIKFSDFFCDENERDRKLQGFMSFLEVEAISDTDESQNQDGNETIVNKNNDVNS